MTLCFSQKKILFLTHLVILDFNKDFTIFYKYSNDNLF